MEIKTKYDINDKVWTMSENEPIEFIITDIEIYYHKNIPITIWYIDENDEGYSEKFVFPTKEELLKQQINETLDSKR